MSSYTYHISILMMVIECYRCISTCPIIYIYIYIWYISQLVVVSMVLAIGPSLHNRATGRPQVLMARPWGRWMAVCCSPAVSMRCVWASNWKAQRHVVHHHCIIASLRSHILYIYISIDARLYMHMRTYIHTYIYIYVCMHIHVSI